MTNKQEKCIKYHSKMRWEHTEGGDNVEYETYYCRTCDLDWHVPMTIERYWDQATPMDFISENS